MSEREGAPLTWRIAHTGRGTSSQHLSFELDLSLAKILLEEKVMLSFKCPVDGKSSARLSHVFLWLNTRTAEA